jgi:hypothetical protein
VEWAVFKGLKLDLPVSATYSGNNATLTASGYYPDYNRTEIWQNDLGYTAFYTGVFVDYGLNSVLSGDYSKKPLVEYNHIEPVVRIGGVLFGLYWDFL